LFYQTFALPAIFFVFLIRMYIRVIPETGDVKFILKVFIRSDKARSTANMEKKASSFEIKN